jgi:hypothetical protein
VIDLSTFTTESQSRAGVKGKISGRAQKLSGVVFARWTIRSAGDVKIVIFQ